MVLNSYTIKQLTIACSLARGIDRNRICRDCGVAQSYITRIVSEPQFVDLIKAFRMLPPDKDTERYEGIGTILMDVGRFLYLQGQRENG